MNTTRLTAVLTLLVLGALGCVDQAPPAEPEAEVLDALREIDAPLLRDTEIARHLTGYTKVERDFRRCVSPLCGGYWVSNLNRGRTRCADGTWAERCYVAEIDWENLGLSEHQVADLRHHIDRVVLLGQVVPRRFGDFGTLGALNPRQAWLSANEQAPRGNVFRVEDLDFLCFTYPCFNLRSHLLNSGRSWTHSGLDLRRVGATDAQLAEAREALSGDQLLVSGYFARDSGRQDLRQRGVTLYATQLYLPVERLECVADEECTTSVYHSPVRSAEDCYCRLCPEPISAAEARVNESGWIEHCAEIRMICPQVRCVNPPPVGCEDNLCGPITDDRR